MLRRRERLLDKTAQTATVTSDVKSPQNRLGQRLLGRIRSNAVIAGTLNVAVQHNDSPDESTGWKQLFAFTQQTNETGNSGVEDVHVPYLTTHLFPHYRAVATIAGGGSYTFTVDLWFD